MLLTLALRNVLRNLRRLVPMILTLIIVFTLLILGNAILSTIVDSLYRVYARTITGDLTVSPSEEDNFTVFGSDQLLVGQYLVPSTLIEYPALKNEVISWPEIRTCSGLVSSSALVDVGKKKKVSTVFGVDFSTYPTVVPALQLMAGAFPDKHQPGMVIQDTPWQDAESLIGKKALLTAVHGQSFTIREVPVTGVFSYPVQDSMLENVVLVDVSTARALNGYLTGDTGENTLSKDDQDALGMELDDMFSSPDIVDEDASDIGSIILDPAALFDEEQDTEPDIPLTQEGAWNFLLISLHNPEDARKVSRRLAAEGYNSKNGYLVRDWSASVGGNARLAVFLQLLFNLGLLFISFGAIIVSTNALLLSVLERTGEIGTLRAMGAGKLRIFAMIFTETLIVVFGSALIGILAGKLLTDRLNSAGLVIDNPYINILFGGKPVQGTVTLKIVLTHLGAGLLFTLLSMLYPLKRALGIQPVEAMAE